MQEVLTLQRLAEVLSISLQTAQALCRSGEIDAFKIGGGWRIPESALDEFMEKKVREHKKDLGLDSEPEISQVLEIYSVIEEMMNTKIQISPEELLKRLEENHKG